MMISQQKIRENSSRIPCTAASHRAGSMRSFGPDSSPFLSGAPGHLLVLLTIAAALVAVLLKTPCRVGGWGVPDVYLGGCYSDWTGLWSSRGFAQDPWAPFRADGSFEYPVLISVVASVLAWIAHGLTEHRRSSGCRGWTQPGVLRSELPGRGRPVDCHRAPRGQTRRHTVLGCHHGRSGPGHRSSPGSLTWDSGRSA